MITAEQRERRRHHIGSSDTAAILGLSPWANAADIYWSKVEPSTDKTSAAMAIGNLLEPSLVSWCGEQVGDEVIHDVECAPRGCMSANLDGRLTNRAEGVEAKYTTRADGWGDPGTDEVPDHVLIQCQHQAHVAALDRVWVPAAIIRAGRLSVDLYCVPRDNELIGIIVDRCERFWRDHVVARIPPEDMRPSLEILERIRRVEATTELDDDAVALWEELSDVRATARTLAKREDEIKAELLGLLGTHEAGSLPGGGMLTYRLQRGAPRCDTKRLQVEHPEIYSQFVTESSHRVLRFKKGE